MRPRPITAIFMSSETRLLLSVREPVDVSGLLELRRLQSPDRPDAVARIVGRFLQECQERLASLRLAVEKDDAPALERAAHALKGIAGTVGANEMSDLAACLEHIGQEGHTQDGRLLVKEIELALERA